MCARKNHDEIASLSRSLALLLARVLFLLCWNCHIARAISLSDNFSTVSFPRDVSARFEDIRKPMRPVCRNFDYAVIDPFIVLDRNCDIFRTVCKLLEQGVAAIFGPASPHTRGIVASIAARYDVPHIDYVWRESEKLSTDDTSKSSSSMTINVFPDNERLSEVCYPVEKYCARARYTRRILRRTETKEKSRHIWFLFATFALRITYAAKGDAWNLIGISRRNIALSQRYLMQHESWIRGISIGCTNVLEKT